MTHLKLSTGISCEHAKELFGALLRGELDRDVERRGRVKGHLLSCEPCFLVYSEAAAEAMEQVASAFVSAQPMSRPPAHILEEMGMQDRSGGVSWTRLKGLVDEHVAWAKEEWSRIAEALDLALRMWVPNKVPHMWAEVSLGEGVPMSEEESWPSQIDVGVVDGAGHEQGRRVRFEVAEPPTVKAGHFQLTLRTGEKGLEGSKLVCTVEAVERVRVTFESGLQRLPEDNCWQARIEADGLPMQEESVVIPAGHVDFSMQLAEA